MGQSQPPLLRKFSVYVSWYHNLAQNNTLHVFIQTNQLPLVNQLAKAQISCLAS